jgi:Tfp pilus assembly protein PilZ
VRVKDTTFDGRVLNVSWSGLFVESGAHAQPGNEVLLELVAGRGRYRIRLGAQVVWKRSELPRPGAQGVGLRIQTAPEAYYDFLLSVAARR